MPLSTYKRITLVVSLFTITSANVSASSQLLYGQSFLSKGLQQESISFIDNYKNNISNSWSHVRHYSTLFYLNTKQFLFSIREFYFQKKVKNNYYYLGKKIVPWNPHQRFWSEGNLNALQGFNLLEPDQEGLIGFHFQQKNKRWDWGLLISALFAPQVNPSTYKKNNQLLSSNEWGLTSPPVIIFQGKSINAAYDLISPSFRKIFFQNSFGAHLKFKFNPSNNINLYGIYKPENRHRIIFSGYYKHSKNDKIAYVKLYPLFSQHIMLGTNWKKTWHKYLTSNLSFTHITPLKTNYDSIPNNLTVIPAKIFHQNFLQASIILKKNKYGLGIYGHHLLENIESKSPYNNIPQFQSAVGINGFWNITSNLNLNGYIKKGFRRKDLTGLTNLSYSIAKHWSTHLSLQYVISKEKNNFWYLFRNNDSIQYKVNYLF